MNWKIVYFFSLLFVTIALPAYLHYKANTQVGKKEKGGSVTNPRSPLWFLVVGLLISFVWSKLGSIDFGRNAPRPERSARMQSAQPQEQEAVSNETETINIEIEPKTLGIVNIHNRYDRDNTFRVISVDKNDDEGLEFAVRYYSEGTPRIALFKGSKCGKKINGTWTKHDDSGSWTAEQSSAKVFVGEHHPHNNVLRGSVPIRLELN